MVGLIEQLRENQEKFTSAQRKLAKFLLENLEKVAFMSTSTLARMAGVSEATVIRFSQLVGYKGFPELKEALREIVLRRLDTSKRLSDYIKTEEGDHILLKILKKEKAILDLLIETASVNDFEKVVDAIEKAKRIFIISHRSVYAIGYYLSFYLNLLGYQNFLLKGKELSYELLSSSKEGDLAIAITFPRYSAETVELFSFAVQRNIETIAITDDYLSPIASKASYVLSVPTDFISFVDSLTAPMSLINAIIVALSLKKPEEYKARLENLEKIWKSKNIYWQEKIKEAEEDEK
ncbi:MAG: MurR/RpiR family transcriptional regulator [Synergistetes bacterium]|nr:MurR/RpiR family transcriptional regulator [Synergistota bacterium]MCX8128127.1 MurR/RpiR family transcriptional regulator [Synergistota bacterium]MDW8192503.1 MurR/RpiR family transcriptional regulator [Synergistota bacterium]